MCTHAVLIVRAAAAVADVARRVNGGMASHSRGDAELVDRARQPCGRVGELVYVLPHRRVEDEAELPAAELQRGGPHPLRHHGI